MYKSVALIAALVALAQAKATFLFDGAGFNPQPGVPYTLRWEGAEGPVTITLKNGPSGNLVTVEVIATGVTGDSFIWTPPTDIPADTYALEINDGTEPNFSPQFQYEGNGESPSSTRSASASSTSSSSATSTSSSSVTTSTGSTTMATSTTSTRSTSTRTSSTSTSTGPAETDPVNTNGSGRLATSMGVVGLAIAAFAFFN